MSERPRRRSRKRSQADPFFDAKRPWSWTKDAILGSYLRPYLEKVKLLGAKILIIDPYAGPGRFKCGEPGSPLIITGIAEKVVPGQYKAIFGNLDATHHEALTALMQPRIDRGVVETYDLSADDLLKNLASTLGRQTVFLYLDPYGLPPAFHTILPFLVREQAYGRPASTEILVNIPPSIIPRCVALDAADEAMTSQILALRRHLTKSMGSDFWSEAYDRNDLEPDEKALLVIEAYRNSFKKRLPFSGSCPIREREGSAVKYYMTFFSGHPHAPRIYNDAMRAAYRRGLYEATIKDLPLLGGIRAADGDDVKEIEEVKSIVIDKLQAGGSESRERLWDAIIQDQDHFMRFSHSIFIRAVKALFEEGRIGFEDMRRTGRLNDDAKLYVKKGGPSERAAEPRTQEAKPEAKVIPPHLTVKIRVLPPVTAAPPDA